MRNFVNTKKIIPLIIIVILVVVLRNIGASIYTHTQNEGTVAELQDELAEKKQEHKFLKERLSFVKSDEFVEIEAREKLGLVRENEYPVFIVPPSPTPTPSQKEEKANWEKWMDVFRL